MYDYVFIISSDLTDKKPISSNEFYLGRQNGGFMEGPRSYLTAYLGGRVDMLWFPRDSSQTSSLILLLY